MLSIGSVSIIALISFLIGKVWSSSEIVFGKRQEAYEHFIRLCPHSSELLALEDTKAIAGLMKTLRDASAALVLYSSPSVEQLVNSYLSEMGQLISADPEQTDDLIAHHERANRTYTKMLEAMKRDSLGLTWFGVKYRFDHGLRSRSHNGEKPPEQH